MHLKKCVSIEPSITPISTSNFSISRKLDRTRKRQRTSLKVKLIDQHAVLSRVLRFFDRLCRINE
jgi:hypothetical protein